MYHTNDERNAFKRCRRNAKCRGVMYTEHDDRYYLKSGNYYNFKDKATSGSGNTPGTTAWIKKYCYKPSYDATIKYDGDSPNFCDFTKRTCKNFCNGTGKTACRDEC